jgi:hypothetical protein
VGVNAFGAAVSARLLEQQKLPAFPAFLFSRALVAEYDEWGDRHQFAGRELLRRDALG